MEKFTPSDQGSAPEKSEPAKAPSDLSADTKERIGKGPDAPETPPGTAQPMEGGGQYYTYSDGQGGLVTPEMVEKFRSPENQTEREPYTFRAVPVDPAQANDPQAAPGGDTTVPKDAPTPPNDPSDTGQASGDQRNPGHTLTAEDEALLPSVQQERARLDAEAKADAAALQEKFRPSTTGLSDSGRRAMQGPPPETPTYPPLAQDVKLGLSNIQDMPVEQRREAMAELFRQHGQGLSNNATVEDNRVRVRDHDGFEWLINYGE